MLGFYADGLRNAVNLAGTEMKAAGVRRVQDQQIRELDHQVQRLSLLNQALWELLRDKLGIDEAALEAYIKTVDLRDGVEDGRMTHTALRCPKCDRVSSSKHWKCLYCGAEFQKPMMG
jgi:hypothetical protein